VQLNIIVNTRSDAETRTVFSIGSSFWTLRATLYFESRNLTLALSIRALLLAMRVDKFCHDAPQCFGFADHTLHTRDVESRMASPFIAPWRIIRGRKSQLGTNLH